MSTVPFARPAGIIVSGLVYAFLSLRAPLRPHPEQAPARTDASVEAPAEAR